MIDSANEKIESLLLDSPDAESARRFFHEFEKCNPYEAKRLLKNRGLLSDILALAGWSSLLGTTLLQNPEYAAWLERQRKESKIRDKEELLDSLARYSATHSNLEAHVLLSRFRRRELLRIYLRDLRELATVAEITAELSNLADAILEYTLRLARQELDNRFGTPLEPDEKRRMRPAAFCIVSLGKLGSCELNYASDIDLLFLYSTDGITSGSGTRHAVTNREYFVKLAELIAKIVGEATGEGAAYRVDLRLRPHGRVGALAVSLKESINYYQKTARDWERQVLLRSRVSAGDAEVFRNFWAVIESAVYSSAVTVAKALENVRLSKQKINQEHAAEKGFNVKLGNGGIREIEFIAQALQLAFGGRNEWLRAPHTLISLSRLADRNLLRSKELTALAEAYKFLRRLEHRLQMEHGLQTHAVAESAEKREMIARKMNFANLAEFDAALTFHTAKVSAIFARVFNRTENSAVPNPPETEKIFLAPNVPPETDADAKNVDFILAALEKSNVPLIADSAKEQAVKKLSEISPYFSGMLAANPLLIKNLPVAADEFQPTDYSTVLQKAVGKEKSFNARLAALRSSWAKLYFEIGAFDAFEKIEMREANRRQTELAEAGLQTALRLAEREMVRKFNLSATVTENAELWKLGIFGLGRLGSRGMDYGSDLDLVLVFDDTPAPPNNLTNQEFYSRTVEILVTALSSLMREGYLYRVDLRLRPDGKNGANCNGNHSFLSYLENRSAVWEWLAFVKLRAVFSGDEFAESVEREAREIIHRRASALPPEELKTETRRVRDLLEKEKTKDLRRGEIDIKHGAGGLLDIYFAVRFLQLRDGVQDTGEFRGTSRTLPKLHEAGALNDEQFQIFSEGYEFLRQFDHALRLLNGRAARIPATESPLAIKIARRLKIDSVAELFHLLNVHRILIRRSFEDLLG